MTIALLGILLFNLTYTTPTEQGAELIHSQSAAMSRSGEQITAAFDDSEYSRFLTDAIDGEAFVGMRLREPEQIRAASIAAQPGQWQSYVAQAAVLEGSNDGVQWTKLADLEKIDSETLQWKGSGPSDFFHNYRIRITESGDEPEVVIATANFEFDRTDYFLSMLFSSLLNALLVASALASGYLIAVSAFMKGRISFSIFFAVATYAFFSLNHNLFILNEFWPLYSPDSRSFILWDRAYPLAVRPPGVGMFMNAFNVTEDFRFSVIAQTNLLLFSIVFLFFGIGMLLKGFWAAVLGLMALISHGMIYDFGISLMSEALFISMMCLSLGATLTALSMPLGSIKSRIFCLLSAISLGATMAIKPLAPALVFAIIWTALLIRPFSWQRLGAVSLPPIAAYVAVCSLYFVKFGKFTLSTLGPLAMAAYVGWWLEPDDNAKYPEFIADISSRVDQLQEEWPEDMGWPFERANLETNSYNTVAYIEIGKAIQAEFVRSGAPYDHEAANAMMEDMAKTAIRQCFGCYAATVVSHYLYGWKLLEFPFGDARARITGQYSSIQSTITMMENLDAAEYPTMVAIGYDSERVSLAEQNFNGPYLPPEWFYQATEWLKNKLIWPVMLVSLLATLLGVVGLFRKKMFSAPVIGLIATSLLLNAFYGAQSLAQVGLIRYSITGYPLFWAILCLSIGLNLKYLPNWIERASSYRFAK